MKDELISYKSQHAETLPVVQALILIIELIPELIQQSSQLEGLVAA